MYAKASPFSISHACSGSGFEPCQCWQIFLLANFHFLHAESDKLKIVYPIRVNIPKTLIGAHSSEKINCFQSGATSCVNNDIMIRHTT